MRAFAAALLAGEHALVRHHLVEPRGLPTSTLSGWVVPTRTIAALRGEVAIDPALAELAQRCAVGADREHPRRVARVVVDPQDPRVGARVGCLGDVCLEASLGGRVVFGDQGLHVGVEPGISLVPRGGRW